MVLGKIENIIFDLGGVLIDIDYGATILAFEELGATNFQSSYSQLNQTSLFDEYEKGLISSQHFINKLMEHLPKGITPNQIVAAWNAMLGKFPLKKIELIKKLGLSYRIFLLSNTNALHMSIVKKAWKEVSENQMNDLFEKVYVSFEIGKRKPDIDIFNWVCQQNGLSAEKTLFIDDSSQHIIGAKKAGLQTYFYENEEDFYKLFS